MQLVVDVGNTETVIGLASGKRELAGHWRISSSVSRTIDEMTVLVRAFLSNNALGDSKITRGVVGSVVPTVNRVWTKTLRRIVTGEVLVIDPRSDLPIELDVEEPMSVGADRIVNTLAARELYHRDTIVVDLGTATTFDCITTEGVFKGGVISPGITGLSNITFTRSPRKRPATTAGRVANPTKPMYSRALRSLPRIPLDNSAIRFR